MIKTDKIMEILPQRISDCIQDNLTELTEIRLRINKPLICKMNQKDKELCAYTVVINETDIEYCINHITNMSAYAFQNSISQGFITYEGGHRIGVAGQAIVSDQKITGQKNISSVNIRIARECVGCADKIMNFVTDKGLKHTLIVSPPGKGKTTILRDCIRQLSDNGKNVAVIDERGEIAATYMGVAQCDLGMRTDILDACPKSEGMLMAVRSMAPDVIAIDEIGQAKENEAIAYAMNCGVTVIATIHGKNLNELNNKKGFSTMMGKGGFEKIIILDEEIGKVSEMICL